MKHLILNIEKKFLIDGGTGEILAEHECDINKVLRTFDTQDISYTMQIWF